MRLLLLLVLAGCGAPSTPEEAPAPPAAEPIDVDARIAAEMLLLNWGDLKYVGEGDKPERTHDEAMAKGAELIALARANPDGWAELIREWSDSPVTITGGRIESWPREQVPQDFSPILSIEVGEFVGPIDGHLGVSILRRVEPFGDPMLSARRLVVSHAGANRAPAEVTRTPAEARDRADALYAKATAPGADFEALVKAESDGHDADRGGVMGTWTVETSRYSLITEIALSTVAVGEVTKPVRTDFGYEIYQRLEPEPQAIQLAGSHLLVSHADAKSSRSDRSRAEALARAEELARQAIEDPLQFGVLARENSDDGSKDRGGDLGAWKLGKLPASLEKTFLTMHFGEVAGPVETEYGFHVLHRRKSPTDLALYYRVPQGDPSLEEEMPEGAEYGVPGMDDEDLPTPEGHGDDDGHDHAGHDH